MMHDSTGPCPVCRENVKVSQLRKALFPQVRVKDDSLKKDSTKKAMFQSKFMLLLKELEKIRSNEPESKSLVFSQFTSTIQWMKKELPRHGFQFRTLSGDMPMAKRTKALREFANDPPTTIFLLSMRAGAVGINLTEANRVFIMEPAMNPALELQAIGRVHRIGQRKKVEVIRLYMKSSIETRIAQLFEKKFGNKTKPKEKKVPSGDESVTTGASPREPSKKPFESTSLGSLKGDRANVTAEEFDLLFGCTSNIAT